MHRRELQIHTRDLRVKPRADIPEADAPAQEPPRTTAIEPEHARRARLT